MKCTEDIIEAQINARKLFNKHAFLNPYIFLNLFWGNIRNDLENVLQEYSNVLNGKTQNEELIRNVEEAIEKLGYRPDANARSLKNTKSKIIGVIVSDVTQRDFG